MENYRFGMLAAMVANTARDPKKRRKPFLPEDFIPETGKEVAPAADQRVLQAKIDSFMTAFGGRKDKKGKGAK